ncbi:MAG: plastocyanin/azurin family copper-binding protein [Roseiflexaceae bacterium]|nr:plastocyanin/azurin family copper-binding protein [Roseiflexaceae bacterium]
MKMVRLLLLAVSLVSALTLAACGGGGGGATAGGPLAVSADGENLAYKPAALTAKAGAPVTVDFNNVSTAQQHNWVLVKGGDDVAGKVDEGAITAGAPDYIPADKADIVANSKILAPGGKETITFTAPAAGTYTYLCTYPGHYAAGMKGTLTVAP